MDVRVLFEDELRRRGVSFTMEVESGRQVVQVGDVRLLVSLDQLQREVAGDGDGGRVSSFVDTVLASAAESPGELSADRLYWCLEPGDYEEPADYRVALSKRADRVLVHLSSDDRLVTWVTPAMLSVLGLSESEAGARAFTNLGCALSQATIEIKDVDGVQLGFINTSLPFKTALILAPNLCEVAGTLLGWPLLAVVPDRDFLYLWAARHKDFAQRVGGVVVHEYLHAADPISTEVYELTDLGLRAIGEFPTGSKGNP